MMDYSRAPVSNTLDLRATRVSGLRGITGGGFDEVSGLRGTVGDDFDRVSGLRGMICDGFDRMSGLRGMIGGGGFEVSDRARAIPVSF